MPLTYDPQLVETTIQRMLSVDAVESARAGYQVASRTRAWFG